MSDTNQNNLPEPEDKLTIPSDRLNDSMTPKLRGADVPPYFRTDASSGYGTSGVITPNKIDVSLLDVSKLTYAQDNKKESPERVKLLNEAADLVQGERQDDYGDPKVNFQRIADYWNTYLGDKVTQPLTWKEIGDMMILLKIARLANSSKRDTYVDIAGYSGITGGIAEEESKNNG